MNILALCALLSGILFGVWPILMNASGLKGILASVVFSGIVLGITCPFALGSKLPAGVNWLTTLSAGLLGGVGLVIFNHMLTSATPDKVGSLIVIMVVAQCVVPVTHNVLMGGGIDFMKVAGFGFAIVGAILLSR